MTRTTDQTAFDEAKHGWSFANEVSLLWRIEKCAEIAKRLKVKDLRHETLKVMREELAALQSKVQP